MPTAFAVSVQQFLTKNNVAVVPLTPAYLTCNIFLLRKMKIQLKGWRFQDIHKFQAWSCVLLDRTRVPETLVAEGEVLSLVHEFQRRYFWRNSTDPQWG